MQGPAHTSFIQTKFSDLLGYILLTEMWPIIQLSLFLLVILEFAGSKTHRLSFNQDRHGIHKRDLDRVNAKSDGIDKLLHLGAGEKLKFRSSVTTKGTYKIKLEETYKGLPVVGEAVIIGMNEEEESVTTIRGHLVRDLESNLPSIAPKLSPKQALDIALTYKGHLRDDIAYDPDTDVLLVIYIEGYVKDVVPYLAYKLTYRIEHPGKISRPSFYIDAINGSVLKSWEGISFSKPQARLKGVDNDTMQNITNDYNVLPRYMLVNGEGGNLKTGKKFYDGADLPKLRVTQLNATSCSLKNSYAIVYDCKSLYECPDGMKPHEFRCDSLNSDYVNGAYSPLNDVLFYVSITYEMYEQWYGITDLVHAKHVEGNRCIARVHYGQNLETAFWDGKYISVGDGNRVYYPLASLDIISHEISHAFTEQNSGLYYENESGAINEAFSDMAGEAAEEFLRNRVDWLVGHDITKDDQESMRFFENPHYDGRSIQRLEEFCFNMDPHMGSGLFNKAFFILSHTKGWGVKNAFHVFVLANKLYWGPDAGFNQAACDVVQAAEDLNLTSSDVRAAFEAVGITPCLEMDDGKLHNPIRMDGSLSITYEIISDISNTLRYADLMFYMFGNTPLGLNVTGPGYRYIVEPHNSIYTFIDDNAVTVHTFTQCHHHRCHATIKTFRPGKVILMPLAFISNLLTGAKLRYSNDRLEVEFYIPDYVLETGLKVAFIAEMVGKGVSVYVRHQYPPVVETAQFELSGHNKLPMLLCSPRAGLYHMHLVADSGGIFNINVRMYALLEAFRVS